MVKVYCYNDKGFYVGIDMAQRNPRDIDKHLIPRNATLIEPPKFEEGFIPKWNGESWDIVKLEPILPTNDDEDTSNNELVKIIKQNEADIIQLKKLLDNVLVTML